jgi:retron-type reverse transcriptase
MAWEMVRANRGSGGVDGQSLDGFAAQLDQQLDRLHRELKGDVYRPQPVRQVQIRKVGKPGEFRTLGIPTIYDRVCQQALLNRLEPIFEPWRGHRRRWYISAAVLHAYEPIVAGPGSEPKPNS